MKESIAARGNRNDMEGHAAVAAADLPASPLVGRGVRLVASRHRQTPQQERQFNAAIDALLSELVRQEMGRTE